jgi:GNAT superfamily N-acetyltransferase
VYFNHKHVSGEEFFWWVSEDAPSRVGLKLLMAIEDKARELGCSTWQMKSLERLNGERMEQLYTRRGYRASERLFIKEL